MIGHSLDLDVRRALLVRDLHPRIIRKRGQLHGALTLTRQLASHASMGKKIAAVRGDLHVECGVVQPEGPTNDVPGVRITLQGENPGVIDAES